MLFYPRNPQMNAIHDSFYDSPSEDERNHYRMQLDIERENGELEVISAISDSQDIEEINRMCSSDLEGGGHQRVADSSGHKTTLLDIHGLIPNPQSQADDNANEEIIRKIITALTLPEGKGKSPLAIVSGCYIPAHVAKRIASKTRRTLAFGNGAYVALTSYIREKNKFSGDFRLHSKNGFVFVSSRGRIPIANTKFLLLPRTVAMSQKMNQHHESQKWAAYSQSTAPVHPEVTKILNELDQLEIRHQQQMQFTIPPKQKDKIDKEYAYHKYYLIENLRRMAVQPPGSGYGQARAVDRPKVQQHLSGKRR